MQGFCFYLDLAAVATYHTIKRTADQMEMDSDVEQAHMRQSQHPLKHEEERESSDNEAQGDTTTVNVQSYTWEMFHKAMKEDDFEVDFDTIPILLHILQHILAMASSMFVTFSMLSLSYLSCILVLNRTKMFKDFREMLKGAARKSTDRLNMWPLVQSNSNIKYVFLLEKRYMMSKFLGSRIPKVINTWTRTCVIMHSKDMVFTKVVLNED
ncbi:hypothetical protein EV363DRAFT_1300967 [Boletus edulis]|nr:hypothetical protein EV363DRAFT_1300967 [Boletus edulis]